MSALMNYTIPLFDLNFNQEEENAVIETLRSKWISTGPKTNQFEDLFRKMLGAKYALALANCTVALHLALVLADIKEGDEIICPSLTFVATVNAIKYVGAKPVFADICSYTDLTIDPSDIEKKITKCTKAIIVMHYGGFACKMDAIIEIAEKFNLKIIEDACHGPMADYKGKKLGTIGNFGCFSFFSNKNISTGEGGMLIMDDSQSFEKAKLLRSHGMTSLSYERAMGHSTFYDVVELGYNYRMDDIRASIGIVQLHKLKGDLQRRQELRQYYINKLADASSMIIPFLDHPYFSSNYIFPIVLKSSLQQKRDAIRIMLAERGIQTSIHYPAVHKFKLYNKDQIQLPLTEYVSDNMITLPLYSALTESLIDIIVGELKECISRLS